MLERVKFEPTRIFLIPKSDSQIRIVCYYISGCYLITYVT